MTDIKKGDDNALLFNGFTALVQKKTEYIVLSVHLNDYYGFDGFVW